MNIIPKQRKASFNTHHKISPKQKPDMFLKKHVRFGIILHVVVQYVSIIGVFRYFYSQNCTQQFFMLIPAE